jgi:hypothetical protein
VGTKSDSVFIEEFGIGSLNRMHDLANASNASNADGHDNVWGKVIEAVEDDSIWAGQLDDFSISVCRKSLPITPVVKQKIVRETPTSGPVPRIEIATPVGNRNTVTNVDVSPLAMPKVSGSLKKKKAKRSSKQRLATRENQTSSAPWDDIEKDFSMPLNDHAVPLEISLIPGAESDEPPLDPHTQESPEDAFHRSFGDLDFNDQDCDEKIPQSACADLSGTKLHRSLGDISSADLEDLMTNPVEFLKSLGKKQPRFKSTNTKEDRTAANLNKMLHGQSSFPQRAVAVEKTEKRPSKNRMDIKRSKSSDKLRSRSVSVDSRNKQGTLMNMRRHRSRSRGVSLDKRKETSHRRERTNDNVQDKRKERSNRDERTIDRKPSKRTSSKSPSRKRSSKSPSRRSSPSKRFSNSSYDSTSSREQGSSRTERTREERIGRSRSSKFTVDKDGKNTRQERPTSRQSRSASAVRSNARNKARSASPMLRSKLHKTRRRRSDNEPQRRKSEEILDLLQASAAGLDHLGLTSEELNTLGMRTITHEKKPSSSHRRPLSRSKSMVVESSIAEKSRSLDIGLRGLISSPKPPRSTSKQSDDLKSTGDTSRTASITQRTSSTSRGSLRSIPSIPSIEASQGSIQSSPDNEATPESARSMLSGASKESLETADRLYKEQAKLAREYRLAEEAKLRRLQEEARLLEEKTRAEEIRLKALQEEARLLEAKRNEEEARSAREKEGKKRREEAEQIAKEEEERKKQERARIAAEEEQKKREEAARIAFEAERKKLEEARVAKEQAETMREEARMAKEQAERMRVTTRVVESRNLELAKVKSDVEKRRQEKKEEEEHKKAVSDKSLTRKIDAERAQNITKGTKSVSTTDAIYKSVYDEETERKTRKASSTIADKLSKLRNDNIQSLPPAFQVIHKQIKR